MFGTPPPAMGGTARGSASGTPLPAPPTARPRTASEIGAQMAAENLTKLSKDDMKSCALTGKRTDTKSWVFVYEQALADVCGDCVHNLFKPAHTGVDLTFTTTEWATFNPTQQA